MQCPTDGDQSLEEEELEECESAEITDDAQAAEAWAPDPAEPMDFKATMAATQRADSEPKSSSEPPPIRLNTTWITLGVLIAFCIGVMVYLATSV